MKFGLIQDLSGLKTRVYSLGHSCLCIKSF